MRRAAIRHSTKLIKIAKFVFNYNKTLFDLLWIVFFTFLLYLLFPLMLLLLMLLPFERDPLPRKNVGGVGVSIPVVSNSMHSCAEIDFELNVISWRFLNNLNLFQNLFVCQLVQPIRIPESFIRCKEV